jgi:hypothetical protein
MNAHKGGPQRKVIHPLPEGCTKKAVAPRVNVTIPVLKWESSIFFISAGLFAKENQQDR